MKEASVFHEHVFLKSSTKYEQMHSCFPTYQQCEFRIKKKNTMDNETKKEGKQAGKRGVSSGLTLPDFKASYIATIMVVLVKE
jgi:hypothetical protein